MSALKIKHSFTLILAVIFTIKETSSFCEQSYVVICDDINDYNFNNTSTWKHVLIGSNQYKREAPDKVLPRDIIFKLQNTKSLTIIYQVNAIRPAFVRPHFQLEHLNLYDNEIKAIEDETFHDVPKLKEIYLDKNKIEFLGRAIFKNTSLEVVSLQFNGIQSITTAFYESKVEWIRLNHNKINYIKWRAFPSNLKRLELNHNLLETFVDDVFDNLRSLQQLSIEHNKLKVLPDISSMMQLQYLHLSFNHIKTINYHFSKHTKLDYIDLSSNEIYQLEADIFSSNASAPIVMLAFNRLNDLKFKNPRRKTDLVLYGNPWICDCLNKIEKILADYKHDRTCELECFRKGTVPLCIENGECGKRDVEQEDVDKFFDLVEQIDYQTRISCVFNF